MRFEHKDMAPEAVTKWVGQMKSGLAPSRVAVVPIEERLGVQLGWGEKGLRGAGIVRAHFSDPPPPPRGWLP